MIEPVARRTVHGPLSTDHDNTRHQMADDANDDKGTRRKIHGYVGSLVFMPNEPIVKRTVSKLTYQYNCYRSYLNVITFYACRVNPFKARREL